jgi:membrane-bound lytic murein transglycosylase D
MKARRPHKLAARLGLPLAAGAAFCLLGCEDAARNTASYHPPVIQASTTDQRSAANPAQHSATPARRVTVNIGALPLDRRAQVAPLAIDDGARLLARQVTAIFAAGEEEQKAGSSDVAREDYKRALDLLLGSGFDITSEPALADLYNQITSAVSGIDGSEQDAEAADANGVPQIAPGQQGQPSPLDEINAITSSGEEVPPLPADAGLRANAERELQGVRHDIPLTINDQVLSFVNFFQTPRGRAIVENGLRRAGRYREMIQRVLSEEGMPGDLIYLAQAESAFEPQALSRAGARGLWQFMAYRGKQYGLEHSWWVDERQDPEKATRAAAQHLRDLYDMFGDWYLVMAAYNSGPGTVQHAVERTGYADFWELYKLNVLPQETRNYVPIIVALTLIAKDPARYGIDVTPDAPVEVDRVQVGHPVDLRLVSETIDVDLDTLRLLNPQLLRLVTPSDPRFVLRIPAGKAEEFEQGMSQIPPENWVSWRRHKVEQGETLSSIAKKYRVTVASLVRVNGLEEQDRPAVDTNLIIPAAAPSQPTLGAVVRYSARRGDTLASVADEFNVTAAELKKWNGMRSDRLVAGMRLRIYPGVSGPTLAKASATVARPAAQPSAKPGQAVTHRVREGETLWSIAQAYQTTIEALRSGNRFLFSRSLQAGDILTIVQTH